MSLAERFHEAGEALSDTLHQAAVAACTSLGLVELESLNTHYGIAQAIDLPIHMLVNERGRPAYPRHATAFTVVPGASDIEDPHPKIILGIENWEKKGYSLSDEAPQLIERSREFMNKIHAGILELDG
ncbi:hypothetical protein J2T10_004146 [Paenarthrobacter nicotinovorans]|uniref:GAF domain-containing protein n=1 Tax=Paenarthrobacter nicotinovorans TaxID=29320 RepID=A0ABT9TTS5_PAENI|nr:hypothetical protein [Paenarthrobacter nicotinovorans]